MKRIVITVALLSATPALADNKRDAGKVLLYTGVGVLAVTTVFAGVLGWGLSNSCGRRFDECGGPIVGGAAGMIVNGPMALSLLVAGGHLYYQGAATPAKTASLMTVHF